MPGVKDGSLIDSAIQGGSQLIEHLSDLEGKDGRERLWTCESDTPFPVGVHLCVNSVEVFCGDLVPSLGERFAVSLCPFDAEPAPLENYWHDPAS